MSPRHGVGGAQGTVKNPNLPAKSLDKMNAVLGAYTPPLGPVCRLLLARGGLGARGSAGYPGDTVHGSLGPMRQLLLCLALLTVTACIPRYRLDRVLHVTCYSAAQVIYEGDLTFEQYTLTWRDAEGRVVHLGGANCIGLEDRTLADEGTPESQMRHDRCVSKCNGVPQYRRARCLAKCPAAGVPSN